MSDSEVVAHGPAEGLSAFEALLEELQRHPSPINEADTRFQVIDRFLVECLGWPRCDIGTERFEEGGRPDYELGQPRRVIWEVKRYADPFRFPPTGDQGNLIKLRSLLLADDNLSAAIRQTLAYCQARGTEIAAVSNGSQLVAFVAARTDGVSPLDGHAFILRDIPDMTKHFDLFWRYLSWPGIRERFLYVALTSPQKAALPQRPSKRITEYPRRRARSAMQNDLRTLTEYIYYHLIDSSELSEKFYSTCYVNNYEVSKYAAISRDLIHKRRELLNLGAEHTPANRLLTKLR